METVEITVARTRSPRLSRLPALGPGGVFGLVFLSLMALVALLAPWIAPYDPTDAIATTPLAPPQAAHLMGTDLYNRDVLSRVIWGAQVSMGVGIFVTVLVLALGLLLGLVAAFRGGWIDAVIGRTIDALMAVPGILLAITIIAALGPGLQNVTIALSVAYLPEMVRVVRGQALAVKERLSVTAAVAMGASQRRIIGRHILPYVLGPTIVQATFIFAHAVLYEAALSFLGLGIQPPTPTWGNLISDGLPYLSAAPLQVIFPSAVVTLTVLAVNLLGDALRDSIDPEGSVQR